MIPHETLEIFSYLWWKTNLITIGAVVLLLFLAKRINPANKDSQAKVIGAVLIFRAVGVHFYWDYLEIWKIESSLPLHLCGLSAILSGLVLFWKKQLAYECLYFWGLPGAFLSLLIQEFTAGMDSLLFFEYYLAQKTCYREHCPHNNKIE